MIPLNFEFENQFFSADSLWPHDYSRVLPIIVRFNEQPLKSEVGTLFYELSPKEGIRFVVIRGRHENLQEVVFYKLDEHFQKMKDLM